MEPIKNGLKCWLEGADITNSSTTWKDRSGNNNNFSITGSLTTEKNMAIFSGSQYAAINNLSIEHGTIEITAAYNNTNTCGFGSWERNNWRFHFGNYWVGTRKKSNLTSGAGSWDFMALQNIKYGDIATYGLSYNESTYSVFCNGKIIATGVSSEIPSITSFYLGLKSDDNTKHAGKIKSLRIYNRKLEPHEILVNYQYELLDRNNNLYVNNNNLPKIVEKLSDASNIKITGNKYGNRVQTVIDKIVEKADKVTKAINQEVVNYAQSFKAGTGNNVNVSTDVQDSFSEIAIKGQTYQNLILQDSMTKHTNVTIENDIVTLLDTYNNFEGITYKTLTKANTTYTVVFNVKEMFKNGIGYKIEINNGSYLYNSAAKLGINKIKITTKEDMTNPYVSILKISTAVGTMKFSKNILLLEGDHTNNPNLPSYFEGIVGVGDKSKNLLNPANFVSSNGVSITKKNMLEINLASDGGQRTIYSGLNIPKGFYTVTIEVIEGNYTGGNLIFYNSSDNKYSEVRVPGTYVVNTNNNDIDKLTLWAVKGICKLKIQIEKGIVSTQYEPYYDGYKIDMLSTGKNLFDGQLQRGYWYNKGLQSSDYAVANINNIPIKTNTCYSFYVENYIGNIYIEELNDELQGIKNFAIKSGQFINTTNGSFLRFCTAHNESDKVKKDVKIQIEENTIATSYESYKQDKLELLLDEPLMKLPNGVYDEITKDGKLIRRIGKIVLDGTGCIANDFPPSQNTTIAFSVKQGTHLNIDNVSSISDKFVNIDGNNYWNEDKEGFMSSSDNRFKFRIEKNKLESKDVVGFKKWLSQNPVTIYYQLSIPTTTELFVPYLRIFKDGHLTFNTLVAPESTHIVQLNKSAQIQNAIKQSQLLDNKITVLENNYDSLMLSTMSTLNDLEFDYTLK